MGSLIVNFTIGQHTFHIFSSECAYWFAPDLFMLCPVDQFRN